MLAPARGFALIALVAALAVGESLCPSSAAQSSPPGIEFVMPAAGAFVASGSVIVAGRLPEGVVFVNLHIDGVPVAEVSRSGRTFSATLAPGPGPHTIEARAGDLDARLLFSFGSGGRGQPPYRYHRPVLEGRCTECHASVRGTGAKAESRGCTVCHRKQAVFYPYVHGPLAAGKCLVCHDPHGSSWPSLTVADARAMCTVCHDQPGSLDHVEKARSRVCYLCHNPHASMNKKFLYDIVK